MPAPTPDSSTPLTLVVLAAGMGSRYGGLKQLEQVGPPPDGATLMDYSVYDAARAGFSRVVFVIRPDLAAAFEDFARGRFGSRLEVSFALQRMEDVPPHAVGAAAARRKPWGTGQAVLAADGHVPEGGAFVVVNADDFYGRAAYEATAAFLREPGRAGAWAIAGYRLAATLSGSGPVNRGVCQVDRDGWLVSMEEVLELRRSADGAIAGRGLTSGAWHRYADDALVSMNMWGFTTDVFAVLRDGFDAFLRAGGGTDASREYLLPGIIRDAVSDGRARVRVLDPGSPWFGITYPADKPAVTAAVAGLIARGEYPAHPWPRA